MEKVRYTYLVEVKCVAPKGYKPRTSTYKGIVFGYTQRDHAKVEQLATADIKRCLERANEGISATITAKATLYKQDFVFDLDDVKTLNLKFI